MNNLQNEWVTLHKDIEKYERFSLIIKLFSVLVGLLSIVFITIVWVALAFILILWLQDGIWKTFQSRLEARILFVEDKLRDNIDDKGISFQLYSQWQDSRAGVAGLIKEYLVNSIKPTVAYPYSILIVILFIFYR